MEEADFWSDQEKAQKIIKETQQYKAWIVPHRKISSSLKDLRELLPEAYEIEDAELIEELEQELKQSSLELEALQVKRMLSHEMDNKNCYLSINAGAGGTESCDWAEMLKRMYQRWASMQKSWEVEVVDEVEGEVAGIKSVTLKFSGPFAFGYSKAEKGVHRLVRISPFDSNKRRHTSFVSVDVTPEITDDIEIELRPEDLKIDTYRASGAGGQHVNVTDSAVRITHLASGIVVTCQNQRSQLQNKETALKYLKSKLYEQEVLEREAAIQKMSPDKKDIAWGSQIRNYVFQPYTLVKDNRTKVENGNIQAVMDGDIDIFINSYLMQFG